MSYMGISHSSIMVVGAGSSTKTYKNEIIQCIADNGCKTLGVNCMTSLCPPDYHLWTNRKQYSDLGQCIQPSSVLLLSKSFPKNLIRTHWNKSFIPVKYSDSDKIVLNENNICGNFRTAGVLAIAIAGLMDAKIIFVCGMDGFTLYGKKSLKSKNSQHCYGKGYTDDASWKKCKIKDKRVEDGLLLLSKFVHFKIITPTKFVRHYNPSILGINV